MNSISTSKSASVKKTALLAIMIVALLCTASTFKADFSGQWSFDPIKSNMSESGMMAPVKMMVTQEKSAIVIQRISRNQQNENMIVTDNISFDGKETEGTGFANSSRRSSMAWETSDAFKLRININGTTDNGAFNVALVEKWSLSADGNILTIDRESNGSRGLIITKHVYNREMLVSMK